MKEYKLIEIGFVQKRVIKLFRAIKETGIRSEAKGMDILRIKLGNYKHSIN